MKQVKRTKWVECVMRYDDYFELTDEQAVALEALPTWVERDDWLDTTEFPIERNDELEHTLDVIQCDIKVGRKYLP